MSDFVAWLEAHQESLITLASSITGLGAVIVTLCLHFKKKKAETQAKLESLDKENSALKLAMWKRTFIRCKNCGAENFLAEMDIDIKEPILKGEDDG